MSNNDDFRPLPAGWYVRVESGESGTYDYKPCLGLIRYHDIWHPAGADGTEALMWGIGDLVYRPSLAHLDGELEVRVVDGVEVVRPEFTAHRRVIGPSTPWPKTVHAMEAN